MTWRLHPAICDFISAQFYEGRLSSHTGCAVRNIDGVEPGLAWIEAHHEGRSTESPEEAALVVNAILDLLGREWTHENGERSVLSPADFMVVAPYNDQVHLVREVLAEDERTAAVKVGTVDKFQGRGTRGLLHHGHVDRGRHAEGTGVPILPQPAERGPESGQFLACVVCNEDLLDSRARTVEDMRLIGTIGAFVELARRGILA